MATLKRKSRANNLTPKKPTRAHPWRIPIPSRKDKQNENDARKDA